MIVYRYQEQEARVSMYAPVLLPPVPPQALFNPMELKALLSEARLQQMDSSGGISTMIQAQMDGVWRII